MHHVNRNTDSHKWSWWIIIISKAILRQNTCLHVGASASKLLSSHLPPGRRRLWRVWRKWRRRLPAAERWSGGAWSLAWCRRCLHGAPCWLQKRQARSPLSETPLEGEMDTGWGRCGKKGGAARVRRRQKVQTDSLVWWLWGLGGGSPRHMGGYSESHRLLSTCCPEFWSAQWKYI